MIVVRIPNSPFYLRVAILKQKTRTALIRETDGYFFPTLAALARDASIFDANGYLKTGWLLDSSDGTWYYLDPENGSILTDWHEINDKWYCFSWGAYGKKFGVMYCDERTPDGYTVDASGAWTGN